MNVDDFQREKFYFEKSMSQNSDAFYRQVDEQTNFSFVFLRQDGLKFLRCKVWENFTEVCP